MKKQLPYEKITLPNGVRLVLVPMEGINSVATSVMVGAGSRYETPAINGISHFLEHMVFKGTQKYPTTDDVNEIERIGGLQNAYTDIDVTNYHNKVLSSDWRLALEINKELAIKPLLDQKHVDKERDVILEEMKRYEDEPAAKVDEVYHQILYPGTKLGMRIIGEEKSLRSSDAKTLRNYHDAWYKPDRIVVVLAGKLSDSGIKQAVEEWFGELKGKSEGEIEVIKENQTEPKVVVTTKPDASQAHLEMGVRTFARGSQERYAWNVFNLLMGVSFTSRLFKEIREKRGLCYHIRSSSSNWADVGNWSIYAGVATDKVAETVSAITTELKKAVDKGVTDAEIAVAKKRLVTLLAFKSEDPEFKNEYYGRQVLFNEPVLTMDEYLEKLNEVTKEDINALIRKYLITQTLNLSVVWNKPKDEKLVKLLKI
jgi:predicted Zn-dependent peptidase